MTAKYNTFVSTTLSAGIGRITEGTAFTDIKQLSLIILISKSTNCDFQPTCKVWRLGLNPLRRKRPIIQ